MAPFLPPIAICSESLSDKKLQTHICKRQQFEMRYHVFQRTSYRRNTRFYRNTPHDETIEDKMHERGTIRCDYEE